MAHQIWPACIIHKITACERYCNLVVHKSAQTVWMLMTALFKTPSAVWFTDSSCAACGTTPAWSILVSVPSVYVCVMTAVPMSCYSHTHTNPHRRTQTHRGRLASTQRHHSTPSPQVHQLFPPAGLSWSQTLASHQRVFRLLWLALSQLADHREAGQGSGSRGKVARLHRGPFHLFSNPPRVGKRLVLLSWLFDEGQLPLITFTEKEKHVKS